MVPLAAAFGVGFEDPESQFVTLEAHLARLAFCAGVVSNFDDIWLGKNMPVRRLVGAGTTGVLAPAAATGGGD
jgi:hypothetical protein